MGVDDQSRTGEKARFNQRHFSGPCSIKTTFLTARRARNTHYQPKIGKGGATIWAITEQTGARIDISDDGTVKIASTNNAAGQEACRRVEQITADVQVGMVYEGRVAKLMDFGAFVTILPGKDGLVHISQISDERVENVSDKLREGDIVKVKVLEIDRQGRIRLSMKAVNPSISSR
jgi:polyribonucleotide nucleotidyltransferase